MDSGQSETQLKEKVLAALKMLPGPSLFWKNHGSIFAKSGVADITGVYLGNMFAIELKKPGEFDPVEAGATPAQRKFLLDTKKAGGYSLVADDVDAIVAFILATPVRW